MIAATSAVVAGPILRLLLEARGRPFGVAPMRARHVRGDRGVAVLQPRADMARDLAAVVKNLDRGVGGARFDFLADEPRRHRVVMVVNVDVIVGRDPAFFPFRIAIGLIRKSGERRPISV